MLVICRKLVFMSLRLRLFAKQVMMESLEIFYILVDDMEESNPVFGSV